MIYAKKQSQDNKSSNNRLLNRRSSALLQKKSLNNKSSGQSKNNLFIQGYFVNRSNDAYEAEADRVARQIMTMPLAKKSESTESCYGCSASKANVPQRQSQDEEELVQSKPLANGLLQKQESDEEEPQSKPLADTISRAGTADKGGTQVASEISSQISSMKGGGQPLSTSDKSFFGSRFGTDFSGVRVHTDSRAADLADSIQAKAFTTGNDIFFNRGQYSPSGSEGKHLLAHELTHVVQQRNKQISRTRIQRELFEYQQDLKKSKTDNEERKKIMEGAYSRQYLINQYAIIRDKLDNTRSRLIDVNGGYWKNNILNFGSGYQIAENRFNNAITNLDKKLELSRKLFQDAFSVIAAGSLGLVLNMMQDKYGKVAKTINIVEDYAQGIADKAPTYIKGKYPFEKRNPEALINMNERMINFNQILLDINGRVIVLKTILNDAREEINDIFMLKGNKTKKTLLKQVNIFISIKNEVEKLIRDLNNSKLSLRPKVISKATYANAIEKYFWANLGKTWFIQHKNYPGNRWRGDINAGWGDPIRKHLEKLLKTSWSKDSWYANYMFWQWAVNYLKKPKALRLI